MLFFIVKKFEPSSGANADRKGGRGGKDAAGRERRCLEGAGRRSASGRHGSSPGVGYENALGYVGTP